MTEQEVVWGVVRINNEKYRCNNINWEDYPRSELCITPERESSKETCFCLCNSPFSY